jgi:hypothetical protein
MVEMQQQLRGAKGLTRVVGRRLRQDFVDLEAELRRLVATVDEFYAVLGGRNWVFHDSLDVNGIQSILEAGRRLDTAARAEVSEDGLTRLYQEPGTLEFMTMRFSGQPGLRARRHLIERAPADYRASRYYSTVLVLLAVMDGFVNDVDAKRRGLHARDGEELHAWDSVAGHHLGLGDAHKSFTKTVSRTTDAECFELHRNGIVHGTILRFDNVIVATKAWNRLFAVSD